jgi:hypothetical protein
MEMMDLRERIEELGTNAAERETIETELREREANCRNRITQLFAEHEADTTSSHTTLVAVRRTLNAVKTLRSLLRDLAAD